MRFSVASLVQNALFREGPYAECAFPWRRSSRMRFSVRARTQNALFRRVRFSSPAQTWSHLTQRRILRRRSHVKAQSAPATSRKGAFCATDRMQSAPFGEAHTQNALFREGDTPRARLYVSRRLRSEALVYAVAPLRTDVGTQECTQIGENGPSESVWGTCVHCCDAIRRGVNPH